VRALTAHPYAQPPVESKQLQSQKRKWLQQQVNLMDKKPEEIIEKTLRFYIIPKIHKNLWKGHLTMPGHACLHSPPAKIASMMLKPSIESEPYVIHGTKHFIKEI
jgi:hypothetical protein